MNPREKKLFLFLLSSILLIFVAGMSYKQGASNGIQIGSKTQFVAVFGVEPQQPMTGTTERLVVLDRLADLRAQKESLHSEWNTNLDFDKLRLAKYEASRKRLDEAERLARQFEVQ